MPAQSMRVQTLAIPFLTNLIHWNLIMYISLIRHSAESLVLWK